MAWKMKYMWKLARAEMITFIVTTSAHNIDVKGHMNVRTCEVHSSNKQWGRFDDFVIGSAEGM